LTPQSEHEYVVLGGVSRASIGRYLTIVSSTVSGALVFLLLQAVNLAKQMGWNANVPPTIMSLIGASAIYGCMYWILKNYAWKWNVFNKVLRVPDLSGVWDCAGQTLDIDGNCKYQWTAEVTIVQCWDKLRIRLKTSQSGSNSMAAALTYDSVDGWVLLYQYRNDPKNDQPELRPHYGCSAVIISKDLKSATAEYFNGGGRATFGKMAWTRRT